MKRSRRANIEAQAQEFIAAWFDARQQVMETNFKRAHQHGLSATQFLLLNLLGEYALPSAPPVLPPDREEPPQTPKSAAENTGAEAQDRTVGALARALNLDQATVVRTVDSLEQRGLVSRRRDVRDRRRVYVELTDAGHAALEASQEQFTGQLATIFRAMRPPDRAALLSGLRAFVAVGRYLHETTDDHLPNPESLNVEA